MASRVTIYEHQALVEAFHLSTPERVEIAGEIAANAIAAAPVVTGEYRGGIAVEVDGDRVSVVDNDETAFFKEYGTSDTPAHATLTDAARQFGRYSGMQPKGRRHRK